MTQAEDSRATVHLFRTGAGLLLGDLTVCIKGSWFLQEVSRSLVGERAQSGQVGGDRGLPGRRGNCTLESGG